MRVFPLLQLGGTASPHVEGTVDALGSRRAVATVETVAYEFQKGGNRMLRLRRKQTDGQRQLGKLVVFRPSARSGRFPPAVNERAKD